jgi:hypothetical protein
MATQLEITVEYASKSNYHQPFITERRAMRNQIITQQQYTERLHALTQEQRDALVQRYNRYVKTDAAHASQLFNTATVNATSFNRELRITIIPRMEAVAQIVNNSDEPFLIWVKQDAEADAVCRLVPDAVEVRGSMQRKDKEERLMGFAAGAFRVMVTKAKIAQYGLNYQHCNNQVFPSVDFSFEALYQSIRRSWRFGVKKPVNIYMITTDSMQNVLAHSEGKRNNLNVCNNL